MHEQFVTCNLEEILVGEPLPVSLYLYLEFRFVTYRAPGDKIDRASYDRLWLKKIKFFIREEDRQAFSDWSKQYDGEKVPPLAPENKEFPQAKDEAKRKIMDIFTHPHPDKIVAQAIDSSKKLVTEVMKFPYAVQSLSQLQSYSKSTADHSVNVSVLSVYLAMQMGYSHMLILQHVGTGALMHDIGKTKVPVLDGDTTQVAEKKMMDHPSLGSLVLEAQAGVPNEVKMIVAQHHECHDGTGYPKKLRGNAIYDLARIVSIANVFDELVADGKGNLLERQRAAVVELDQKLYRKFDPQKLEKVLKILKMGL